MSRSSFVRAAASVMALAATAAVLAGCGDHTSPVAPAESHWDVTPPVVLPSIDYTVPTPQAGGDYPVLHRSTPLTTAVVASGVIGQKGGIISLPGTGLYVYFPQGAVQKKTTFTVSADVGTFVTYTFEPHTIFQQPVALIQDLTYTNAYGDPTLMANIQGGYLADGVSDIDASGTGNFAETFTAYVLKNKDMPTLPAYAVFFTTHFSGYAYASGRSSIDPTY